MPKKLKEQKIIERFNNRGLTLLNIEEYRDKNSKLDCEDMQGYKYLLTTDNVCDKRTVAFSIVGKTNPYSIKNIQNLLKINNSNTIIISTKYIDPKRKLEFICGECGKRFSVGWNQLRNTSKYYCNDCGRKRIIEAHKYSIKEIKEKVNSFGYELINIDEKTNTNNINIVNSNGYKYKTTIYNLEKRTNRNSTFNIMNPYSIENMKTYLFNNDIDLKILDTSLNQNVKNTYLRLKCISCGKEFRATWTQITIDKRYRCENCVRKQSNISYIVEEYLKDNNIKYIKEYRFNDCRNKNPLPFDYYLPLYNYAIEVNGAQHYYEDNFFQQSLAERQKIDKIKKEYCEKNQIGYLEIPFWLIYNTNKEKEEYKHLINNILNQK